MRKSLAYATLSLVLAASGATARADVTWEHTGTLTMGDDKPQTLATFDSKISFTPQRCRQEVSYDASGVTGLFGLPGMPIGGPKVMKAMAGGPPIPVDPSKGSSITIKRLDDDRLIMVQPALKQYYDEPLKEFTGKVRINFWKDLGLDDTLGTDDIPSLTTEQRVRLGAELRAVASPIVKKGTLIFYRALPDTRVISGLTCHGFRLTLKVNTGAASGTSDWATVVTEWWIADEQPGDEDIHAFTKASIDVAKQAGPPTASMWANELPWVLYYALPKEFQQSVETFTGPVDSPDYGFVGTPAGFYVTITPPADQAAMIGSIKLTVELKSRSTDPIPPAQFDPPDGYSKESFDPILAMIDNLIKMQKSTLDGFINKQ